MFRFSTIATAGLVMIAMAAPAFAKCGSDEAVERRAKRYGVTIDAASLSNSQMAHLCAAFAGGDTATDIRRRINAALKVK